ncbi:TRAP transporter substrate-binding protein DctP [Paracoccus sp. SCSIO 75233]|uniref:TRAP transporter substrate-binding protein n=1 Tax=Paracoccus sp. SCSIO 75233 TaxID=3017782 RepID=UPI0022F10A74|nr:TRAP transporter substrate-binding protein DctP [Paracoccus sp. SCSIO 75233]WBU52421.1 TRAP transporter substrate-binding protein DctP [Paracoccus sp. SCSIO 75233]
MISGKLAFMCFSVIGSTGFAQDFTLRIADSYPTTHVQSREGAQFFIDRVEELSGGRIEVEYFPASQLGKAADMLTLVQSGTVDMAYVAPAYVPSKMPLSDVAGLPGLFSGVCEGTRAYLAAANTTPLKEVDFDSQGVHLVFANMNPPYQISGPRLEIKSLDDIRGKKIRSSGNATNLVVEALGGVPVNLPGAEVYDGLERGTIDFNLGPYSSYKGYDLYDQTKFGTAGFGFSNFVVTYVMRSSVYDGLTDELKSFIDQAGEETSAHVCEVLEEANTAAIREMEELGATFFKATPETLKDFEPIAQELQANWVENMVSSDLPGKEALESMRAALADN